MSASLEQLKVRNAFKTGCDCWQHQTKTGQTPPPGASYKTREYWYTSSIGSGLFYYDYFMKNTLPDLNDLIIPTHCISGATGVGGQKYWSMGAANSKFIPDPIEYYAWQNCIKANILSWDGYSIWIGLLGYYAVYLTYRFTLMKDQRSCMGILPAPDGKQHNIIIKMRIDPSVIDPTGPPNLYIVYEGNSPPTIQRMYDYNSSNYLSGYCSNIYLDSGKYFINIFIPKKLCPTNSICYFTLYSDIIYGECPINFEGGPPYSMSFNNYLAFITTDPLSKAYYL
jgi:hypothetical protein